MAGICDIPGIGQGCNVIGGVIESAATSTLDLLAQNMADAFGKAVGFMLTFWTQLPIPTLSNTTGPVADLSSSVSWYTAWVLTACLLVGAGRMIITRSAAPGQDVIRGVFIWILVSGAGVAAINAIAVATDQFSTWIIERSTGGDFGSRLLVLDAAASTALLGPGLTIVLGVVATLATLCQAVLMVVRVAVVTIVAAMLPLAAAGSGTQVGRAWFFRLVSWVIAFLLYKPLAAIVYAAAFFSIGDGESAYQVLTGIFLIILAVMALPALLRLVAPAVGAIASPSAGAGMATAAAGAGLIATGARMVPATGRAAATTGTASTAAGAAVPPAGATLAVVGSAARVAGAVHNHAHNSLAHEGIGAAGGNL